MLFEKSQRGNKS